MNMHDDLKLQLLINVNDKGYETTSILRRAHRRGS